MELQAEKVGEKEMNREAKERNAARPRCNRTREIEDLVETRRIDSEGWWFTTEGINLD